MKKLFKVSISKVYIAYLLLLTTFVIGTYSSYAYFTVNKEKKNAIKMITGNLVGELKVDGEVNDKLVVNANETKTFEIEVANKNNRQARFNFYYKGSLPDNVEAGYVSSDGYNPMVKDTGVNLTANGSLGYFLKYQIKVKNNTKGSITIPLGYEVGLDYNDLSLPENTHLFEEAKPDPRPLVEALLADYTNDESIQDYDINYDKTNSTAKENKMYVFNHTAGTQQSGWSSDELKDYRYIGANPNNYVTFNNEKAGWRIIGIETVDDGTGKKEKRVKLIRKDPLPVGTDNTISFDNKPSGTGSSESEYGSNDWYDSRLMYLLNPNHEGETTGVSGSIYWNRQSGNCPKGQNNATTTCDFSEVGLLPEAQTMIGDAKWYLGGTANYTSASNGTSNHWYSYERGETLYSSSTHPRKTNWTGKVGLMYPSDYGYATSGGSSANRETCLAKELYNWDSSSGGISNCKTNDWLYNSSKHQWTIAPYSGSSNGVLYVNTTGSVYNLSADLSYGARPVVYLKAGVELTGGNGSTSNPFTLDYTPTAVEKLLEDHTNPESTQDYDVNYTKTDKTAKENKMYVFNHEAGTQQSGWSSDELKDYRYIGKDPNNYVTFNNEEAGWRIIGIETVDNGTGKKEKRIKLIRKDFLTPNMSFDNKPSGTGSSESSNGSNDWTDSRLMMILNPGYDEEANATGGKGSLYWNRQSGSCPSGSSNASTTCNFEETGLLPEAQAMIGDAKWYLGGNSTSSGVLTEAYYKFERSETVYSSSAHPRKTNWTGKVGLMYPSDYGYATSGGATANRVTCLAKELHSWNSTSGGISDCKDNDWLYNSSKYQWTISPVSVQSYWVFSVTNGNVSGTYGDAIFTLSASPVIYLKASTLYESGDGSSSNPFVFKEGPNIDDEAPVCKLTSSSVTTDRDKKGGEGTVTIECTDNSGTLKNDLTSDNINFGYKKCKKDTEEKMYDIKTILSNTETIENGKRYTFTMNADDNTTWFDPCNEVHFMEIKGGVISDNSSNQNIKNQFEFEVSAYSSSSSGLSTNVCANRCGSAVLD